ncbi:MAG: radical SAM protein [Deltaproteobacteria bacterium]|nr:radical SAM protein [Deltaproteobacteria bacterium]
MTSGGGDAGRLRLRDFPRLVSLRREAKDRARLLRQPDLTYLFWECTLRCNLRCAHCGSSCEAKSPLDELSTEQILRVLDTIAEDFDTSRIFVSITGGEPLLRKDLDEVVAHMTRIGLRSCIVTNGTLLDEARARRLFDAGMRTVTVSVDGLEAEHDAVRGKGTWPKALAALGAARRAGITTVEAITCVRPANLGALRAIERAVRDAGAQLWRCITIDRMGRLAGQDAPDMWLEPPQVRALLDHVAARRAEIERAGGDEDVRFSCGGFLGVRRERDVRPEGGQCYAGSCIASILCNGDVGACPSIPRAWAREGSVLQERFSTIWRERFARYRDLSWRHEGPCEGCSWFDTCLGGGLHERLVQPHEFCWLDRQGG